MCEDNKWDEQKVNRQGNKRTRTNTQLAKLRIDRSDDRLNSQLTDSFSFLFKYTRYTSSKILLVWQNPVQNGVRTIFALWIKYSQSGNVTDEKCQYPVRFRNERRFNFYHLTPDILSSKTTFFVFYTFFAFLLGRNLSANNGWYYCTLVQFTIF